MRSVRLVKFYKRLLDTYGPPGGPNGQWRLWCKRRKSQVEMEEVIIGAILTQRISWRNVEIAIANLKKAGALSFKAIARIAKNNSKKLGKLIKSAGFYKQKTEYLRNIAQFFLDNQDWKSVRRDSLLKIKGVGPETADSILLYALHKPVFVIDEYTRRFVEKYSLLRNTRHKVREHYRRQGIKKLSYDELQKFFESRLQRLLSLQRVPRLSQFPRINLKQIVKLYQDFHALIVIQGKTKGE